MPRFAEDLGVVRAIEERLLPECRQGKEGAPRSQSSSALVLEYAVSAHPRPGARTEQPEDRDRKILQSRTAGAQDSIAQEHAGHIVWVDAVVPEPGIRIIFEHASGEPHPGLSARIRGTCGHSPRSYPDLAPPGLAKPLPPPDAHPRDRETGPVLH